MKLNKIKKAFTLIELLVWMSIITIIIVWSTNIDYNRMNDKQKLEMFSHTIKANFEKIRNNTVAWKWVWNNLDIPDKWKIEYSKTNNWTIQSSFFDWVDWSTPPENLMFQPNYYISDIKCIQVDWTVNEIITWSEKAIIEFDWIYLKLSWDCINSTSKILELTIKYKIDTKVIQINSLNWLFHIK